jgi:hypothetical protein
MCRLALQPTQRLIQWVIGALLPWVKWQGSEADHLPPSGAEIAHIHAFISWYVLGQLYLFFNASGWKSLIIIATNTRLLPFRIYEIFSD